MERTSLARTASAAADARSRFRHSCALTVVVILAGFLRFGGITDVGIRYDDEGAYATDARLWNRCAVLLLDTEALAAVFRGDKAAFQGRMRAHGIDFRDRFHPTQGYTFPCAMMMFLAGDGPAGLLATNALFGTLAVIVLYGLGATLFNRTIGLCGAFLLAVSPYHLVYCRTAFTDATAGFFVLLGLYFWARGRSQGWSQRKTYGWSGVALGYALTCHFRMLYVLPVLLLTDFLANLDSTNQPAPTGPRWRDLSRRWVWLAAGVAVPIVAMESVFLTARLSANLTDSFLPLATFVEAAWLLVKEERHCGAAISGTGFWQWNAQILPAYTTYFVHWHGLAAGILTAMGLAVVASKKGLARMPVLVVVVPLVVLMFQPYVVARAISATVPFLCLSMATGLYWFARRFVRPTSVPRPELVWVLTLLVAIPAVVNSQRVYSKRSQVPDACTLITACGGGKVAVPVDAQKYAIYLEDSAATIIDGLQFRRSGAPGEVLARLRSEGVRWLITDPQIWHYRQRNHVLAHEVYNWWRGMYAELAEHAVLAARFSHLSDYRWEFLAEGPGVEHLAEMVQLGDGPISVYDLSAEYPTDSWEPVAYGDRRRHAASKE